MVHSVDSLRVAEEIQANAARTDDIVDVLIQVSVVNEPTKHGVAPPAVIHFAEQIQTMVHMRLRGLMVMAPACENPEDSRTVFARTKELLEELKASGLGGRPTAISFRWVCPTISRSPSKKVPTSSASAAHYLAKKIQTPYNPPPHTPIPQHHIRSNKPGDLLVPVDYPW